MHKAMRMRFLLSALGLVLCFGAAAVLFGRGGPATPPQLAFPALASRLATADRIELVHAGHVLWLERRGQVWGMSQQGGYPVRPALADGLIGALLGMSLIKEVPGTPETLGLADPFGVDPAGGTFIRVYATSGATLCAIIAGSQAAVRRPGDPQAWATDTRITLPADAEGWTEHVLPPFGPAQVTAVSVDGGVAPEAVQAMLPGIEFTDVAPAAHHHPARVRQVQLLLTTGSAVLTIGLEQGQPWLTVSGTSPWASKLAPYAFALPANSKLAAF